VQTIGFRVKNFPLVAAILMTTALAATDVEATTVRGRVDRQTSFGIVTAGSIKVTLKSTAGSRSSPAYTNPQGVYYIYNVPTGNYVLEVWSSRNPVTIPITVQNVPVFNAPTVTVR
jgi:hypothetical protein